MTTLITTSGPALGRLLALAIAPAFWPGDAAAHTCDDPLSTDLIAGRTIDAGDVKVCNDDTTLTITYEATFPWCLLETNLHVATSKSGIPRNKPGNPIPGTSTMAMCTTARARPASRSRLPRSTAG